MKKNHIGGAPKLQWILALNDFKKSFSTQQLLSYRNGEEKAIK